jgi:hypothetical protein
MDLNDFSYSVGQSVGKLVGGTRKVLSWPANTLTKAVEKLRSVFPSSNIRAIVTEELMHFMAQKEPTEEKLEQRLKVMAETIMALQERLDEMVTHGRISETDMLEALDSIKTAESLTNDERMVLVNVFRQNIALQKPEFVETAVGQA